MKIFLRVFISWLPLAAAITCLSFLSMLVYQQVMRQQANDPQIEMAESAALALQKDGSPESIIPNASVELTESISPFIMLFDAQGDFVLGDATLHGEAPTLPSGLLDENTWIHSKKYNTPAGAETRVTWQPEDGVREALVIVHAKNGEFVAVGRSLRDTEERNDTFSVTVFLAWVGTLGATFLLSFTGPYIFGRATDTHTPN